MPCACDLRERSEKDGLANLGYSFMPPLKPLAVTEEVATLIRYIVKEKQLMTGTPFSENVTRLWELLNDPAKSQRLCHQETLL